MRETPHAERRCVGRSCDRGARVRTASALLVLTALLVLILLGLLLLGLLLVGLLLLAGLLLLPPRLLLLGLLLTLLLLVLLLVILLVRHDRLLRAIALAVLPSLWERSIRCSRGKTGAGPAGEGNVVQWCGAV
ncbi:hypothetical membrane protein [Azoarcus olearius]|uniref:Hypothetical membrane protein n=1 Tax=Azoarcus sp. (strain BH72) TaxID=418699 RepID=A1K8G9_AZOSB|nr:hypothetical membrane protein [Azoarcus olearius]